MSKLNHFITQGTDNLPVYITDVRNDFLKGDGEELTLDLEQFNGAAHRISLKLPIDEAKTKAQQNFLREYLFAEVYNILSALGGVELRIYTTSKNARLDSLIQLLPEAFGIGASRKARVGYGRSVNVIERLMSSRGIERPFVISAHKGAAPALAALGDTGANFIDNLHYVFKGMKERILCGVDIGGTDIKLAVSMKGKLCYLKEYDWFPALFTRSDQLIKPVQLLVRLLRARVSCDIIGAGQSITNALDTAINTHLSDGEIERIIIAAEAALGKDIIGFDSIGLCFPDVVIRNKIVGGEVFKTRGIRENPNIEYEEEFRKLMDLDELLSVYCAKGGRVHIINDGPMAAFTAAVELLAANKGDDLRYGRFAHTLGTELGSGWIDERGEIPEIPLEIYNFIIDLGSFPARGYHPDDVRSINNFNTKLPGTLQKFMAQNGVFRLAIKASMESGGGLFKELLQKGFLYEDTQGVFVSMQPKDMRKPLLEYLMKLCEDADPLMKNVFREIGRATGITFCETEHILSPRTKERTLYGRLVKLPVCFELIKEGAYEVDKTIILSVADDESAFSDLMLQLKAHPRFSVAQFAQAIGAIYYANRA